MILTEKIRKFLIVGTSAAILHLGMMFLFVEVLGFSSYFLKNVANIVSGEIALVYAFTLNRNWTWKSIPRREGRELLWQFILYHVANGIGILIKIAVFALLQLTGLHFSICTLVGIGMAAIFDFLFYDKLIFNKKLPMEEKRQVGFGL